jgi:L-asparagine transporter-like permease
MSLSPPKQVTWVIALILTLVGLLANLMSIPPLSRYAFWFVLAGAVLLLLATMLNDL